MGSCLKAAKSFRFSGELTWDERLRSGQKVQCSATTVISVRRPDGLHAERRGDLRDVDFWYDGKSVTLMDAFQQIYATHPAPPGIEAAWSHAMNKFGVSVPVADIILASGPAELLKNVRSGIYVKRTSIRGVWCSHLAFRDKGFDWQVWVAEGPQPVPMKLVITYLNKQGEPQSAAVLSGWELAADGRAPGLAPPSSGPRQGGAPGAHRPRVFWHDGLWIESPRRRISLKIGGRVMADWGWMDEDSDIRAAVGSLSDHTESRRLRLYGKGRIGDHIDFKLEGEFAGSGETLKDAYLGFRDVVPLGYLKIGHFKEPFGLEELTSSNHITFMERAVPANAFSPSRNLGIQLSNHHLDERLTWAAGAFREVDDDIRRTPGSGSSFTARLTGLPWYEDEGSRLLHLGVAASYRAPRSHARTTRFSSRPALHLAPGFINTGTLPIDDALLVGVEAAVVRGPFSIQGECTHAHLDDAGGAGNADLHGAYIEASYFLTGEHRRYSKPDGTFGRVSLRNSVGKGGLGAWQVAARYDYVDLNDGRTRGGVLGQWTLGLNWHLNPNARVMFNYANARLYGVGRADLFGVRCQVDF